MATVTKHPMTNGGRVCSVRPPKSKAWPRTCRDVSEADEDQLSGKKMFVIPQPDDNHLTASEIQLSPSLALFSCSASAKLLPVLVRACQQAACYMPALG